MVEFKDLDLTYVKKLIELQEPFDEVEEHLDNIVWGVTVYYDLKRAGVCYVTRADGTYFLDAYKDRDVKTPMNVSVLTGDIVIGTTREIHNVDKIYSAFKNNRATMRVLENLGFKIDKMDDDYTLMVKEF